MESSKQVQSYKRFDALTSNATRKFVWVSFGDEPHNGNHLSAKKRGCLPQHNIATKVEQQQSTNPRQRFFTPFRVEYALHAWARGNLNVFLY